ncbi:ArnT family glycosyltransferase [Rubinisphaera italica]|uniref:Glycosyltransferase RgtA/B/C/D-like domain-containing protein n=1 Tax=Rubinisphaera italica TaxID=2527969 RepID=A0A5C5XH63_9PLAN|nr:glycosyltransferase family 39 protein [Rubinisphaera italica]TWT61212.1 hypothetical protein Pan54_19470 [Rubinisphaera italica]
MKKLLKSCCPRDSTITLTVLLIIAFVLRASYAFTHLEELSVDRDFYLGIGQNVWEGHGFSIPGSNSSTAFRPPLYILIVAVIQGLTGLKGLALFQCLAGVVTVWATWHCGRLLKLGRGTVLAASFVTFDPILLRYTALAMTEVTFTMLVALTTLLWLREPKSIFSAIICGIAFGITTLCRPSIWPMLPVIIVVGFLAEWITRSKSPIKSCIPIRAIVVGLVAFLTVLPWGLRNAYELGHFKITTTHGGYTFLLGNNSTFYEAVLHKSLGTTWGDYPVDHPLSQTNWYRDLTDKLDQQGLKTEFERDRAQYKIAFSEIQQDPSSFCQAILLRQLRLWAPIPQGPEANGLPNLVFLGLWVFYLTLYLLTLIGMFRLVRSPTELPKWVWVLAILITFSTVHSLYWSNARMRAPVIPALALLAGRAISTRHVSEEDNLFTCGRDS